MFLCQRVCTPRHGELGSTDKTSTQNHIISQHHVAEIKAARCSQRNFIVIFPEWFHWNVRKWKGNKHSSICEWNTVRVICLDIVFSWQFITGVNDSWRRSVHSELRSDKETMYVCPCDSFILITRILKYLYLWTASFKGRSFFCSICSTMEGKNIYVLFTDQLSLHLIFIIYYFLYLFTYIRFAESITFHSISKVFHCPPATPPPSPSHVDDKKLLKSAQALRRISWMDIEIFHLLCLP